MTRALRSLILLCVAIPMLGLWGCGTKTGTCPFYDQRLKQSLDTCVLLDKDAAGTARRCDSLRCMAPQFLLLIFLP